MEKSQVKDGDTGRFIREHMVEEWQPVTIRRPVAGWFNLALQTEGFVENEDYFVIPWDDGLPEETKEVFATQGDYENILFGIKVKQEDAETACGMAMQEPQFVKGNEELLELTNGVCDNSLYGFIPAGAGYISTNRTDIKKAFNDVMKNAIEKYNAARTDS